MQNKTRLELADYEAENLARLQKLFARKWELIYLQAEAQIKYVRLVRCRRLITGAVLEWIKSATKSSEMFSTLKNAPSGTFIVLHPVV